MRLRWSNEALDELAAITDFVAQFSDAYADELVSRITSAANRLADFPEMGRLNDGINSQHVRELLVEKYRLIYYVDKRLEIITVLSLRHQSQQRR